MEISGSHDRKHIPSVDPGSRPQINPALICRKQGEAVFLIEPQSGAIEEMEDTTARIWELCDGSIYKMWRKC